METGMSRATRIWRHNTFKLPTSGDSATLYQFLGRIWHFFARNQPHHYALRTHTSSIYKMAICKECVDFALKYSGLGNENWILNDKQIQTLNSSINKRGCHWRSHFVRHMTESSSNGFLGNTDEVRWRYGIGRVATNEFLWNTWINFTLMQRQSHEYIPYTLFSGLLYLFIMFHSYR